MNQNVTEPVRTDSTGSQNSATPLRTEPDPRTNKHVPPHVLADRCHPPLEPPATPTETLQQPEQLNMTTMRPTEIATLVPRVCSSSGLY